jgi:hypothetical protein
MELEQLGLLSQLADAEAFAKRPWRRKSFKDLRRSGKYYSAMFYASISKVDQQPFLGVDVSVNAGLDADCDYPFPNKAMLEVLT